MSRYLRAARFAEEKIHYFYNNAGSTAYDQAKRYWGKLPEIMHRASRSKNDTDDVPQIQLIIESLRDKMDEMETWKRNHNAS